MKPSSEVVATLQAIATEIGAGKSFSSEHDHQVWNDAHERCLSIIANYRDGVGLFQMTGNIKAATCPRAHCHEGPCNGVPRSTCPGAVK